VHREWLVSHLVRLRIIGAFIATSKGRGCFWFLLCSFLGPIGLLLAAVTPRIGR